MKIESDVNLQRFNTLSIQSTAQYFAQPQNVLQLQQCYDFAQQNDLTIKVLGGGSNVVMADVVMGLVVQFVGNEFEIINESDSDVVIRVGAGFNWHELVMNCLDKGFYGLENLAYIPGHVGAAPVQNIGAYGVEVKDFIERVNGVYLATHENFSFNNAECRFEYRESCFKQNLDGQCLITSVEFRLSKIEQVKIDYSPLKQMAEERGLPSARKLADWVIEVRKSKLPEPSELPNAGSFFKNPVVDQSSFETLISLFPTIPHYFSGAQVKLAAGWMIDQCGLKGQFFGPVSVHQLQALVLINHGGTAQNVASAAQAIKDKVQQKYGIELEQEPRLFS